MAGKPPLVVALVGFLVTLGLLSSLLGGKHFRSTAGGKSENAKITEHRTMHRIAKLRKVCGQLCNTSRPVVPPSKPSLPFGTTRATLDCKALILNADFDAQRETRTPVEWNDMPEALRREFLMQGRARYIPVSYKDQMYLGGNASQTVWSVDLVQRYMKMARARAFPGNYGVSNTNALIDAVAAAGMHDKRVLVVGSEFPWVEAILLVGGAKHVVTLEYGRIESHHPQLSSLTPDEFRAQYERGKLNPFDVIVSFSSVEHSGLGRYGDALNPWGDLITMSRTWCVAQPGATLLLAVPILPFKTWREHLGLNRFGVYNDYVQGNWHRTYGPARFPLLATNWELVRSHPVDDGIQPVHTFTRLA